MQIRTLHTRKGIIKFPAYFPVTTFGDRYPLDGLLRPYLDRLAQGMMVSYHYAREMREGTRIPVLVDSGGFASLFDNARLVKRDSLGILEVSTEDGTEGLRPDNVLDLQERIADVAFSLDFPIPPAMEAVESRQRLELTIANAHWALANRRRSDLPLYACVQGWDPSSARDCARSYANSGFDGIAIGGLVPRAHDPALVLEIVESVRSELPALPLHVFGLGKPNLVDMLFKAGVDSVDSSSYVKLAADGRLWSDPDYLIKDPSPTDRLHLALCNLATATGAAMPLSSVGIVFKTHALFVRAE